MRGPLVLLFLLSLRPVFGASAADVDREIQQIALDPQECYRVLELSFSKEDLKIYLTSGYLIFSKPTNGVRLGAAFVASSEAGDAELLLLPPTRGERLSLANFTGSPNLEEHFQVAAFVFTDGTGDQLRARLQADSSAKKSPEMGTLIGDQYTSVLRNLTGSFETRLVYDLLSGDRAGGLFYLAVSGNQLGNFDVLYDPTAHDQIVVGKLSYRENRAFFDIWTSFQARSRREGAPPGGLSYALDNFRIEADIDADLGMKAVTRATLALKGPPGVAIPFSLTRSMHVTAASIDGRPVEVFERESLRSDLLADSDDRQFLLVTTSPLDSNQPHEIEVHHQGAVIRDAGGDAYYVGSRGTWYPRAGGEFANYDLTFRYPKNLKLVATARTMEDRIDGDWRISHSQTEAPIRFAGFNLGDFQSMTLERDGYKIDLYSNRKLNKALDLRISPPSQPPPVESFPRRRLRGLRGVSGAAVEPDEPDATSRVAILAQNVADTMSFMTAQFGPTPIRNLAITPIPGGFGQGFPGLVYLSTLSYLNPGQLPVRVRESHEATFYTELLETHEVAHQWWGNLVISGGYHDEWLIESLANYSALLLLEKKKGIKAVDSVLDEYRNHLLTKTDAGRTLEDAGPITWGLRLESSLAPDAWRTVTYEKGTWIIHMLRRRLGDQKFLALLREICSRYRFKAISTEQFRELAQQYMPPSPDPTLKTFFENWVYGTGIPSVKLTYTLHGLKLTGTLAQTDVDDNFTTLVPIEVQTGRLKSVYWFATGSDTVSFTIPVKAPPTKVSLLTADCLLRPLK